MQFRRIVIGIVIVGAGTNGDVHFLSILGEGNVAGPVTAAAQASTARKLSHNHLLIAPGLEVAILVRKAHH